MCDDDTALCQITLTSCHFTDRFSGPGRAFGRVCVCTNGNSQSKRPLTQSLGVIVQLDPISMSSFLYRSSFISRSRLKISVIVTGWKVFLFGCRCTLRGESSRSWLKADLNLKFWWSNSQPVGRLSSSSCWTGRCDLEWQLSSIIVP